MGTKIETLRKQLYNAEVVAIRSPQPDVAVLRVRPDQPIQPFLPGQWTQLGLGMWESRCQGCPEDSLDDDQQRMMVKRPYSLSSPMLMEGEDKLWPESDDTFEFFLALAPEMAVGTGGPALTARLFALKEGSRLWVDPTPQGNYTLDDVRTTHNVAFLATGTGEAPHNRMVWELLRRGHKGHVASAVTVRKQADLVYRRVHERLEKMFPNYRYVPVPTQEPTVVGSRLQSMLESGLLEEKLGAELDPENCHVFLCGNPGMLGRPEKAADSDELIFPKPPGMLELLHKRGYALEPPGPLGLHFE
jgi:ferredoxin--NADP+ reductase